MLQRLADHIADGYTRAADSESRSRQAANDESRASYLRLAQGGVIWPKLRICRKPGTLLVDLHKKGWPLNVEDLPMEEGS